MTQSTSVIPQARQREVGYEAAVGQRLHPLAVVHVHGLVVVDVVFGFITAAIQIYYTGQHRHGTANQEALATACTSELLSP